MSLLKSQEHLRRVGITDGRILLAGLAGERLGVCAPQNVGRNSGGCVGICRAQLVERTVAGSPPMFRVWGLQGAAPVIMALPHVASQDMPDLLTQEFPR